MWGASQTPRSRSGRALPFSLRRQKRRTTFSHGGDHGLEAWRKRLARQTVELGLGVEGVDVARSTFHEQENDTLRRAPYRRHDAAAAAEHLCRPSAQPRPDRSRESRSTMPDRRIQRQREATTRGASMARIDEKPRGRDRFGES